MPEHRDLNLQNFLHAAGPDLLEQYFLRLFRRAELPPYLVGMNPDYVLFLLDQIEEPLRAVILEDFRRVNDICHRDLGLPLTVAQCFHVPVPPDQKPQTIAIRLFLDHPKAFNLAWALYSHQASWGNISQHWLQQPAVRLDNETITRFTKELETFFVGRNQGSECRVSFYDLGEQVVILVLHGSHIRTVTCWQGRELAVNCFRQACDDVLIYDKHRAVLSVKAFSRIERDHYIHCFASLVLGNIALAADPERDLIYTLEPLQEGNFTWSSSGPISAVERVGAKIRMPQQGSPVVTIEGDGIDIAGGEVMAVKLKFTVSEDGKRDTVTFTIAPPCISNLVKKRHADVIASYLREKGILLR